MVWGIRGTGRAKGFWARRDLVKDTFERAWAGFESAHGYTARRGEHLARPPQIAVNECLRIGRKGGVLTYTTVLTHK